MHTANETIATPAPALSVLVVDDETDVRKLLAEILEGSGYHVAQAEDGKEAFLRLDESHVDLLITDLIMPEREGLETISRIRTERPEVKIIAMSGSFEPSYLRAARLLGADRTIQKPFTFDDVLTAVEHLFPNIGLEQPKRE